MPDPRLPRVTPASLAYIPAVPAAPPTRLTPARVALLYAVVSGVWVVLSDHLLAALHLPPVVAERLGSVKGLLFVAASGLALYALVRRAAAQQERERGLAAAVLAGAAEPVLVSDAGGRYVLVNRAAERLLGRPAAEIVGRTPAQLFTPAVAAGITARAERVLATGTAELVDEQWAVADGRTTPRVVRASVAPFAAASGGGLVCVARDVTQRREAEEAMRQREAALRQGEKLEALGRMAGGIAHDVNNVLTIIATSAHMAAAELDDEHPARVDVDEVLRAATRAGSLMRRLLRFTRHRTGEREVVRVDEAVADVAALVRPALAANVELAPRPLAAPGAVSAEPGALTQMVMNLVLNAAAALPDGGVIWLDTDVVDLPTTGGRAAGERGAVDMLPPGRYAVVRVIDTGTGMDAATLARAAEPFFTTRPPGEGTGLGLATVHALAHQHGGAFVLSSAPSAGTTATIYLPQLPDAAAPADDEAAARPAAGRPARATLITPSAAAPPTTVLLAEDETVVRALGRRTLELAGFTVVEARHGADALALVEQLAARPGAAPGRPPVDVVVTDVVMPEMGGPALVTRLRERWPALPVLFVSGYTAGALPLDAAGDDRTRFLDKPFAPAELVAAVRGLIGGSG